MMAKEVKYIDIHCHPNFPEYDADREETIKRANDAGVGMICVGTGLETSKSAVELAKHHENMWATAGIHPTESVGDINSTVLDLENSAMSDRVVAIGECGLDYFHAQPDGADKQRELFIQQILLANKLNKPLMLHIRNGKNGSNAYQETVGILKEYAKVRANFHFFAGSVNDLKDILDINCTVSFTGVITFTHDYDELVRYAPLDRVMSETDSPFVAPVPFRGKRNEPANVTEVVKAIARIRGKEVETISENVLNTAINFFEL